MHRVRNSRHAFTLIELLVVMAVIAVFLGVLGAALSGGGGTMATQAGQRTLTTMISGARSQAVMNQASARLIIHADPPTAGNMGDPRREKYLRFMAILVKDGTNTWREINDGTYLPKGIYVVPPWAAASPSLTLPSQVISTNTSDWAQERRTVLGSDTMRWTYGDPNAPKDGSAGDEYLYIEFAPRGTTGYRTDIGSQRWDRRIVVAPARSTGIYPEFEPGGDLDVLGGMIRQNGSFTLVSNPESFPDFEPIP